MRRAPHSVLTTLLIAIATALAGVAFIAAPAHAAPATITIDHVTYSYDDGIGGSPATITAYDGPGGALVLPSSVDIAGTPHTVVEIGFNAFFNKGLTAVTLPGGLTTISQQAFSNNSLTEVNLPNGVTSLGTYSFLHNPLLTSVTFSSALTTIDTGAFYGAELGEVSLPDSVTTIGFDAFHDNAITTLDLGSGLTTIGGQAFTNNQLVDITLPAGVTTVGPMAFSDNHLLTAVRFLGDAPTVTEQGVVGESFDSSSGKLRLHYLPSKQNWTNPEWNGYTTVLEVTASDLSALHMAADQCPSNISVTLLADLSEPAGEWAPQCNTELDLNGHDLTEGNIIVAPTKTLTIDDKPGGGALTASASTGNPGIMTTGSTLVINAGTVVATGGSSAAGIGGDPGNSGGTTTINGTANVTATGGAGAAGIGGGAATSANQDGGSGGIVTISGSAVVTAKGVIGSTGIGGGNGTASGGDGAQVTIGEGAEVTAYAGPSGHTAIGSSAGLTSSGSFGHLTVEGTLHLPTGALLINDGAGDEVAVSSTGVITGSDDPVPTEAQVSGEGQINNAGSITLSTAKVTGGAQPVKVKDHHYKVSFDSQGGSAESDVTVFAKSFDDGARTLPTPTKLGYTFTTWNYVPGGSGTDVGPATTLSGSSADGTPVAFTLYAQWTADPITGFDPTITGTVREGQTLTAHEGTVTPVTTTYAYKWKRNGAFIDGADDPTYKLKKADAGRKISVMIIARAPELTDQIVTSPETALVSSPYARIVVSLKTVKKGQSFTVTATGLKANQRYAIWLGGTKTYTGYADANGTVSRTAKFKYSTNYGTRRVRVSGYKSSGKRTFTIYTTVKYVK